MGSQTYSFQHYSQRGLRAGTYLRSNTFSAGRHKWAISLYPGGINDQCSGYLSLYVCLMSEETDMYAMFQLTLVDQSGEGKHKACRLLGRGREKQVSVSPSRGIQWGFPLFMNKSYLEELGYLKDDCLVVKCEVGVLPLDISSAVSLTSNQLALRVDDQVKQFMEVQRMKKSNWEDTVLSYLLSVAEVIIEYISATAVEYDQEHEKFGHYWSSVATDDIMLLNDSLEIPDHGIPGIDSIKMLQLVFREILENSHSVCSSGSSSPSSVTSIYSYELQGGSHTTYDVLSTEQIHRLSSIVERLNSAGCLGDCNKVYRVSRKSAVNARLQRFGIQKWNIHYLKGLNGEDFTRTTRLWILAAYDCFHNIFPGEKQYYEQIFGGLGSGSSDNFLMAIVKDVAVELIDSLEAIINATASFQYLFDILDLYEAISVALPKIKATFRSVRSVDIYSGATKTIGRLIILARKLLSSFEDAVLYEQSDTPLATGKIHSATKYVMDYVSRMLTYHDSLADILGSMPAKSWRKLEEDKFLGAQARTPLEHYVSRIIIRLRINLEGKSCYYRDPSLRYAFLLCNVNHIIQIINESPELLEMIGEEYLSKLSKDIETTAQNYVSSTWDRVLYSLGDDGLNQWFAFYRGLSGNALKQKLKKFNKSFEEVCETQCTQLGPHLQLRGLLLELILKKLIPAYKSFLDKFTGIEGYNQRHIKYSLQDLQNKVHILYLEH